MILFLVYLAAGYWAVGKTIYYNKVVVHQFGALFLQKFGLAMVLGWILIPVAIILTLLGRR